jgi:hypothetical protein
VQLLAWYYHHNGQSKQAAKMLLDQQESQFHLMNSPECYKLLVDLKQGN